MKLFSRLLEKRTDLKRRRGNRSGTDMSPTRVRVMGVVKLVRNAGLFTAFCYAMGFNALLTVGFGYFVYFSWGYVPEIVTGVSFAKTSERARGVTILLGLSTFFVLLILAFVWLSRAATQSAVL